MDRGKERANLEPGKIDLFFLGLKNNFDPIHPTTLLYYPRHLLPGSNNNATTHHSVNMSTISSQSQITTAFSCYVLFFLPLWVVLPAMNEYIIARRCFALHGVFATTGSICGSNDVSASAQNWSTWTMLACNLPSLLVVLPLGHLADRWGRRTILLWCLGTQVFGSAGMLLVCLFRLDLIWMVPTYVVNGFGGGSYTLQTILLSTLVDCSNTRSHRARLLATMTAMYYFCGCVGPLVGGYLSKANLIIFPSLHGSQYQLAYVIFFVSNALVLLLAVVSFEETLPPPPPPSKDSDSDGGSGDLRLETTETICSVFRSALAPLRSRQVRVLSVVFCLMYATVNVGVSGLIVAYAKLKMFDMSDETIGIFLALPWFLRAVSAAIIFPLLLNYFVVRRESSSKVSNENRMSSLLLLEEVFSSEDDAELECAAESAQRAGNAATFYTLNSTHVCLDERSQFVPTRIRINNAMQKSLVRSHSPAASVRSQRCVLWPKLWIREFLIDLHQMLTLLFQTKRHVEWEVVAARLRQRRVCALCPLRGINAKEKKILLWRRHCQGSIGSLF